MRARTQNGYYCLRRPIGYKYELTRSEGKILVLDEPVASIIREGLEGYASGLFETATEVQQFFKEHPSFPEHRRASLGRNATMEILTRPTYAGYITAPEWDLHMVPARHPALIILATHQRILDRVSGRAKAPARSDLNKEFPLRGFINCVCGNPLMGCFSTSRSGARHAYYLCQRKGCTEYGKSIRRQVVEDEFERLLTQMTPTPGLIRVAHHMLQDMWDSQASRVRESAKIIKAELAKISQSIEQPVDRVVEANSPALVETYEKRIQALDRKRALLVDEQANPRGSRGSFDELFRTALDYLANPQKLWVSDRIEDKRAVLKLTFADRLTYARNEGFRTAIPTLPFSMLDTLKGPEMGIVPEEDSKNINNYLNIIMKYSRSFIDTHTDTLTNFRVRVRVLERASDDCGGVSACRFDGIPGSAKHRCADGYVWRHMALHTPLPRSSSLMVRRSLRLRAKIGQMIGQI
jgi:hypothetical protein